MQFMLDCLHSLALAKHPDPDPGGWIRIAVPDMGVIMDVNGLSCIESGAGGGIGDIDPVIVGV
jgi:hypothetical protein